MGMARRSTFTRAYGAAGLVLTVSAASAGCNPPPGEPAVAERVGAVVSTAPLQLKVETSACVANQAMDYFQITNTGSTAIKLSDVKIKYWIDDTTGQSVVPQINYGGCASGANGNPSCVHPVTGVTAAATSFSPACGPDANHQANWEITVSTTDGATLPAGATWANIQTAVHLANYSNFNPGASKWFSPCVSPSSYVTDPHFSVYYQGNLVFSNGLGGPECRAPHGTQPITSYTPPPPAPVVGLAPSTKVISLSVGLSLRDLATLQTIASQASDPSSPTYRQYVTSATVLANHAPTQADYDAVVAWAQGRGFKVVTYANRIGLDVTGTVAQIEQAFYANVILATRPDGSQFYRLDRQPSVDLGVQLLGVSGLDNYVMPRPLAGTAPIAGTYQSSDLRGAYAAGMACNGLTGAGQSVGLFQLTGFSPGDITAYQTNTGLAGVPAVQVLTANDPNGLAPNVAPALPATGNLENWEIDLDIEMAMAMAPGAQVVVFEGTNPDSVLTVMTNNPNVRQISSSWGVGTSALTTQLFTLMAAQGQSFFQSSGDFGSYQPAMPMCPAAIQMAIAAGMVAAPDTSPTDYRGQPFVTVVGGSVLSTVMGAWSNDTAWSGSGGGILTSAPLPAYQVNANPGNAELSAVNRNLPDVSMPATAIYIVTSNCNNVDPVGLTGQVVNMMAIPACPAAQLTGGIQRSVGGTSASAPMWAGFMALANQAGANAGLGPIGFANPAFYQIGRDPMRAPTSFHDVTAGTTNNTCGFTYTSQVGYDLTTGWGTPQCGLIAQLNQRPTVTVGVSGTATGGPFVCVNGQGFTPGGTVTVQYGGVPEVASGVKVVSTTQTVAANGNVSLKDNEKVFVAQAVAGGIPSCTPQEIATGLVSVNVIDNTTGISATTTMPASYWCGINQTTPFGGGCNIPPVTIHYSQYAACTHVPLNPGIASVDPNAAYVVFQVEEIDNQSSQTFNWDPNRSYVQQATKHFADSTLRIYDKIFGPFAAVPDMFGPGVDADFQLAEDLSVVVTTSTSDGAVEANATQYNLLYDEQLTDPPVTFVKTNSSQTSWPVEQDCCSIGLAICLPAGRR
jgi:hypothetical protein